MVFINRYLKREDLQNFQDISAQILYKNSSYVRQGHVHHKFPHSTFAHGPRPMTQPDHDIQVAVLNTKLELISEPGLQIIKHDIRKAPKENTLERDGFHLTDYGGRIIAQAINENVSEITRKPEPKPEIDIRIHKIETTQERAKFVIGKQGTRITTLKEKYNVNVCFVGITITLDRGLRV